MKHTEPTNIHPMGPMDMTLIVDHRKNYTNIT
jgi:hypothetical protein